MTYGPDPYAIIDPILMPWAEWHGICVDKDDRGWHVRSIWVYDKKGNRRAQMWADLPDADGNVTLIASVLDPKSLTKWGAREERRASLGTLACALEELRPILFGWAGPGAYT